MNTRIDAPDEPPDEQSQQRQEQARPAVVCLSGGMDSTSLLVHLLARGRDVYGISFDYGQKHRVELQRLQANLDYLAQQKLSVRWHLVDLTSLSHLLHSALVNDDWDVPTGHYEEANMKATVVPNRNAIFASIAYAYALSIHGRTGAPVELCLGVHAGDHAIYPDCRPEFYQSLHHAFALGNWDSEQVSLELPYLTVDKGTILADALRACDDLNLDFETVFRNTCTSYQPDSEGRSHGMTGSDVERILAFHQVGRRDPLDYQQPWDEVVAQALQLESEFRKSVTDSSS
ncbi:MAG: 7-cyano-7-deazaguanine synthase [Planctomycetota bacterium]|nr:7-cyano-7-deazaguanine synthase [Planctomycetota bacterium]